MDKFVIKDDNYVIGIVGGMGSYATVDFFRRVIDAFPAEKEWERPRVLIDNYCTMPSRVRAVLYNEKRDELVAQLTSAVAGMLNAGVDKIVFACNTSHIFVPDVIKNLPECEDKVVHIIEACREDVHANGFVRAGLVSTEGTIETGIYSDIFAKRAITIDAPTTEEYTKLREFIEAVKQDNMTEDVLEAFVEFVEGFEAEAVILGCTELPILYNECIKQGYRIDKKIFDPLEAALKILVESRESYK